MKKLFLVILIAQCCIGYSQSLKADSTFIKGKKHLVYPYRFEWEENYTGKDYYINDNIPPIFDSLPSGEYLMYFGIHPKKIFAKKKQVGARFSVSKGKINGKVIFYNTGGKIGEECDFKNGIRHGERKLFAYKKNTLWKIEHYEDGVLKGLSKDFYEDGTLMKECTYSGIKGNYINISVIGDFKEYYPDGKLRMFFTTKTPVTLFFNSLPLSAVDRFIFEKPEIHYKYLPFNYPYSIYHSTGKFLGKISSSQGEWGGGRNSEIHFDTLFNASGKIAVLKLAMTDTLGMPRFRYDCFDSTGKLSEQQFYVIDEQIGILNYKTNKLNSKGELYTSSLDYQFMRYHLKHKNENELTLLALSKDEHSWDSTLISPKFPEKTLYKYYKAPDNKKNFSILKNDYLYSVVDTIEYKNLKVISYSYKDTIYPEGFYDLDAAFISVYSQLDMAVFSSNLAYMEFDSIQVFYKNKPFNGKIHCIRNKSKGFITLHQHKIIFDIDNADEYNKRKKEIAVITVENGSISKIVQPHIAEDDNYFSMVTPIKNNVIHGIEYGYDVKKNPFIPRSKKIHFENPYENGFLHGKSLRFRHGKPEEEITYEHGIQVDTSFYYNSNGKPESIIIYGKNGKKQKEIEYHSNGKIAKEENFLNDNNHGIKYELSEQGDTLEKMYYNNDTLEGCIINNKPNLEKLSYIACFENGQMKTFDQKDESGVLRVKVRADSSRIKRPIYFTDFLDNSWEYSLQFTGNIEIYHPNGRLYFKGHALTKNYEQFNQTWSVTLKTGIWNYYNSMERKIIEINYGKGNYKDSLNNYNTTQPADYKEYYDNGQLKYSGTLTGEEDLKDCTSDVAIPSFQIKCYYYFSPNGDTLVNQGNGKLQRFYANGDIHFEVNLKDALMEGWYKEYNREKKLIAVGQYLNGKKHGRWLHGDLTGINYLDENCFLSEQEKKKEFEENKMQISIDEIFYDNNVLVNTINHNFTRSK